MSVRDTKFDLTEAERSLPPPPIDPHGLKGALLAVRESRIGHFVQSYVRDRVPAAFNASPLLWEAIRRLICDRIAQKLNVRLQPTEVGLNGSANLGFSPVISKWGKPYGNGSDLDLFLVNEQLFELVQLDAARFLQTEDARFADQRDTVRRQLEKGFVSTWQIPASRANYRSCTELRDEASVIVTKLKAESIDLNRSFFRVFSGWPALGGQLHRNFASIRRKLENSLT